LKGDIVEAIQVLRMMYQRDLMFREPPPSALELALEGQESGEDEVVGTDSGVQGAPEWALDISDVSDSEI
jgi:hypothetical protein